MNQEFSVRLFIIVHMEEDLSTSECSILRLPASGYDCHRTWRTSLLARTLLRRMASWTERQPSLLPCCWVREVLRSQFSSIRRRLSR